MKKGYLCGTLAGTTVIEAADALRVAIETQHGGRAIFRAIEAVDERHDCEPVWQGEVHVFDLENHPSATIAYAWSSPVEGSDRRRFYAVLHLGGIRSARDAVRAAIVAEKRQANGRAK